jgi:hypothetical protein
MGRATFWPISLQTHLVTPTESQSDQIRRNSTTPFGGKSQSLIYRNTLGLNVEQFLQLFNVQAKKWLPFKPFLVTLTEALKVTPRLSVRRA